MKAYFFLPIILSSLILSGCSPPSKEVQMVKSGSLKACPLKTLGEMVSGFMGNPSWSSGVSSDGSSFVNVQGEITIREKPATALLQFMVDMNAGTYEFNALEFNEIGQNKLIAAVFLKKMCEDG